MGKLRAGDVAPSFQAQDAGGRAWSSEGLRGRPFVIYFYPMDETPGCVAEACGYRNLWGEFEALGVLVMGVSGDDAASHEAFAKARRLPFPLLLDPGAVLRNAFGAWMFGRLPRRVSYLVDAEGRIVEVFDSNLRPGSHPEAMLAAAKRILTGGARTP